MRHLLYVCALAGALLALSLNANVAAYGSTSASADSIPSSADAGANAKSDADEGTTDVKIQLSDIHNSIDSCNTEVTALKSQTPDVKQMVGYGALALVVILLLAAIVANIVAHKVVSRKAKTADEDESKEKAKKSAEKTAMKLANAEKRIAALEKQLQLLSAQMCSVAQQIANSGTAQDGVNPDTAAQTEPKTFYMPQPSGEREFDNTSLSCKQNGDTMYVFHRKVAGKAEFELAPVENALFWALENKPQAIETVCEVTQDNGGNAVVTICPGTAELSGGKWIVRQKAQVIIR